MTIENNTSYDKYVEDTSNKIREHSVSIYEIWIEADMFVYARTKTSK